MALRKKMRAKLAAITHDTPGRFDSEGRVLARGAAAEVGCGHDDIAGLDAF